MSEATTSSRDPKPIINLSNAYTKYVEYVGKSSDITRRILSLYCDTTTYDGKMKSIRTELDELNNETDRLMKNTRGDVVKLKKEMRSLVWKRRMFVFAEDYVRSLIDYYAFAAQAGAVMCAAGFCMSVYVLFMDGEPVACEREGVGGVRETFVANVTYRTMLRAYGNSDSVIRVSQKDYEDAKDAVMCGHICWSVCMISFVGLIVSSMFQMLLVGLAVGCLSSLVAVIVMASVKVRRRFFLYFMLLVFLFFACSIVTYFSFKGVYHKIETSGTKKEELSNGINEIKENMIVVDSDCVENFVSHVRSVV